MIAYMGQWPEPVYYYSTPPDVEEIQTDEVFSSAIR